jgi:hypothetical protein
MVISIVSMMQNLKLRMLDLEYPTFMNLIEELSLVIIYTMKLEVGDTVKIYRSPESFWVVVKHIHEDHIVATVDNEVESFPYGFGDDINVNENEIISFWINDKPFIVDPMFKKPKKKMTPA